MYMAFYPLCASTGGFLQQCEATMILEAACDDDAENFRPRTNVILLQVLGHELCARNPEVRSTYCLFAEIATRGIIKEI